MEPREQSIMEKKKLESEGDHNIEGAMKTKDSHMDTISFQNDQG